MIRDAIKGLPREKLFIQTKMGGVPENPLAEIDKYRKTYGVDYIDSLLVHCTITPNWEEERKRVMDAMQEAKEKKIILAHGVSCHSLPALKRAVELDWVDVHLVRVNPQGASWTRRGSTRGTPRAMRPTCRPSWSRSSSCGKRAAASSA